MRVSTILLQLVCVGLGFFFLWFAFYVPNRVLLGGIGIGALFLMSAALLGADRTTNSNATGRGTFVAKITGAAFGVILVSAVVAAMFQDSSGRGIARYMGAIVKIVGLLTLLAVLIIDTRPRFREMFGKRSPKE